MITYEVLKSNQEQRQQMKSHGCTTEFIEVGVWNISCEDENADWLAEYLESETLENRMV